MDVLLGEIRLFPYGKAPEGWLECAGQTLYIAEYGKLYMLLGTRFGGDGKQKFKLPDLRKQTPEKMICCLAVEGEFPNMWAESGNKQPFLLP